MERELVVGVLDSLTQVKASLETEVPKNNAKDDDARRSSLLSVLQYAIRAYLDALATAASVMKNDNGENMSKSLLEKLERFLVQKSADIVLYGTDDDPLNDVDDVENLLD